MAVRIGGQLGPYEILGAIGAGGMGEVFRARDTRLRRIVAIKVLPADKMSEPDRKRRFLQEARAVSALNHPNIVTLYDIANDGGVDYLVMEYVPGKPLDQLLSRSSLSLDVSVHYAAQIAGALVAAHAAGIVHRDIKPANVIVTPDSQIKILDFGLAKLLERAPVGSDSEVETQKTTLTESGTVMGTVAYMSPEQVSGRDLDHRTDIFSLGVVLYEMLAGRRPFLRTTQLDTMHAILHDDPPSLADIPPRLNELLEKTLAKDPAERYQHAGDLALDLRRLEGRQKAPAIDTKSSGQRSLPWIVAFISVVILIATILWLRLSSTARQPIQFTFEPPDNTTISREGVDMAISPDGRRIAFIAQLASGTKTIFVRSLDAQEAVQIAGTDGATNVFWSANGDSLGFFGQGKLKRIAVAGGPPQIICDTRPGLGATWNKAGDIVFNPTNRAPLMRVSASGGTPVQVTTLDSSRQENSHRWPSFLPDGRHFLFTARSGPKENTAVYVGSLDSNETKRLLTEQSNAVYSAGYLLFGRDQTLMAQRFDPNKLELSGNAFPVAGDIDQETPSANAFLAASADGSVIAYHEAGRAMEQLTWFNRDGSTKGVVGTRGLYGQPRLSPDGKRLAVNIPDPVSGNRDIWIINLENASRIRFTSNPANDWFPVWSPDGAYLAFASDRTTPPSVYRKALSGGQDEELPGRGSVTDWSADGRYLLLNRNSPNQQYHGVWLLDLAGDHKVQPIFTSNFQVDDGALSPDAQWAAYISNESGAMDVYIHSVRGSDKQRVSANGGHHPRWRGDGKEVFYVTSDNKLMVAEIRLGEPLRISSPQMLFPVCDARRSDSVSPDYEVTRDGKSFIASCQAQEVKKRSISVAIQWTSLVKNLGAQ